MNMPVQTEDSTIDSAMLRQVLGQFPTGVVVVTALGTDGVPAAMTVGSFTSVSLDPPLVAFLPSKTSSSWATLRSSGDTFCVNVLAADQEEVCRAVATRKVNRLSGFAWHPSEFGNPVLDDAVAFIDCTTEAIHDAGDHEIVIGRVRSLEIQRQSYPLLFFRGGYGSFVPKTLMALEPDLIAQLRQIDVARLSMERLAAQMSSEVTAITMHRGELVMAASAGEASNGVAPMHVGERIPFLPPLGSVYAAWGDEATFEQWISRIDHTVDPARVDGLRKIPELVRTRGYALSIGHARSAQVESLSARLSQGDHEVTMDAMLRVVDGEGGTYNPDPLPDTGLYELRHISAPVFFGDGRLAFTLLLWGPAEPISRARIDVHADALLEAASAATEALRFQAPEK